MKRKSRKVKAATRSKVFMSKKKLKGNIPLQNFSDSDADVDSDSLLRNDHDDKDQELSTDDEDLIRREADSSEEEEVLPITDDEKDESEEDIGDLTEDDEEEGLPNPEAWGKKKSSYFHTDFVDEDRGKTYREEDAEKAKAEEEEALNIQRGFISSISYGLEGISKYEALEELQKDEVEEEINLESLDKDGKMKYLKKKCPELLIYINDFKEKLTELKDRFLPLLGLVRSDKIESENCVNYIKLKYQLLLHYCMNISFYMVVKSNGSIESNHPVVQRINHYKKLLDSMNNINGSAKHEIDLILKKLQQNEVIPFKNKQPLNQKRPLEDESCDALEKITKTLKKDKKKNKKLKSKQFETETEKEILSMYQDMKKQQEKTALVSDDEESLDEYVPNESKEGETEDKRKITYQIAKNKGLTARRKKEHRNPRVHHRIKFKKAKIRRKGQVREVIREVKRYGGEPTGISTHVVKSIKFK